MRGVRRAQGAAAALFLASLAAIPLAHWRGWTLGLPRPEYAEAALMMLCLAMLILAVLFEPTREEKPRD